jgi:hypothetical protein
MPAGHFTLTAEFPGYLPGVFGRRRIDGPGIRLELGDRERRGDVVIRMWKDAAIAGRVLDEAGEPLVGLTVQAMRRVRQGGRIRVTLTDSARTDDRGAYRLGTLTPGDYFLLVPSTATSAPMASTTAYYAALSEGTQDELRDRLRESSAPTVMNGVRQGDHVFALSGSERALAVAASGAGSLRYATTYHPASPTAADAVVVNVGSGETREGVDIRMTLRPTVEVAGVVSLPDGLPAARMGVHLQPPAADLSTRTTATLTVASTVTDAAGRFTFPAVPAGAYTLSVVRIPRPDRPSFSETATVIRRPGGVVTYVGGGPSGPVAIPKEPTLFAERAVIVADKAVTNLTLGLEAAPKLAGRLVFDGTSAQPTPDALARVSVSLDGIDEAEPLGFTRAPVDEGHTFETMGYPPGRYRVGLVGRLPGWRVRSVTAAGREALDEVLTLGMSDIRDVVVTLTDRVASLSGTVQSLAADRIASAQVVAVPAEYQAWIDAGMSSGRAYSTGVDRTGAWSFDALRAGNYLVAALDGEAPADLRDPDFISRLARVANRVTVTEGGQQTLALAVASVR